MKKTAAWILVLTMVLSLLGTAVLAEEKEPGSVDLFIMLALGQWTDNFDELIEAYKAENPQIGTIDYEFPSSSTYWDLLKSKLASGEMPDIFGCNQGEQIAMWGDYLATLDDMEMAADLTEAQRQASSLDGGETIQIMPIYVEGWGIIYNMRLLKEAGWEKTPETREELAQLLADLKAAGINPFMAHYAETSLALTNHIGSVWMTNKEDPLGFIAQLKSGADMDLANDPDLNDLLDYYDLILEYCNEDYLSTDKWVGRNAFYLEEYAMEDDEGSWEIPNILGVNPPLCDYVVQGLQPISNDAAKNRLQTATINAGIYKDGANVDEAKKFLDWLIKSETAQVWHQEKMGNIPAHNSTEVLEGLSTLGQDVFAYMQSGKAHEVLTPWTPDGVKDAIGEVWSLYVGKQIDRPTFYEQYQAIWTDYANSL